MLRPYNDVDLHAFVDKQVGAERRVAIATYLTSAPEDGARVDQWTRQNDAVKAMFSAAALESVPLWLTVGQIMSTRELPVPANRRPVAAPTWRRRSVQSEARSSHSRTVLVAALAFSAGLGLAVAAERMPFLRSALNPVSPASSSFEAGALEAHRLFALDSEHPVDISPGQVRAFLRARLPFPVRIPDLQFAGWTLLGGRLVQTDGGAGALLVYGDLTGARLSLVTGQAGPGSVHDDGSSAGSKASVTGTDRSVRYAWMTSKDDTWLSDQAGLLRQAIRDTSAD